VRVLDPHSRDHALPGGTFTMDPAIGWRLRASHSVTHRTRYFTATYTTNAMGYRDRARSEVRTPGRTRVLVFGDSQIFGWGVAAGRRFTDLLEARRPELEVWNLGVLGYGFDQELLEYERRAESWNGDIVVLFATRSTLERSKTGYLYRKHKPRFVLHGGDSLELVPPEPRGTALTEIAYRLLSPFYLPYFIERRLTRPGAALAPVLDSLSAALFARAARIANGRGDRLVVLTTLSGAMLEEARRIGRERGFDVVAIELPGSYPVWTFGPEDAHWTERTHELVADRLADGLARR
jgi:hypothetical protein